MGNLLKALFAKKMPKKQCKIVMLGLDGAGKTTILYSLKLGEVQNTIPTIGFNVQELNYKKIKFMVWDVGGQEKLRALWSHYYQNSRGLIYVIDSSDHQRIDQSASELQRILSHEDMKNAVVLILANKRDVATLNLQTISQKLKVHELKRNWGIFPIVAIKDHASSGLPQAIQWLIDNIQSLEGPQKHIKVG